MTINQRFELAINYCIKQKLVINQVDLAHKIGVDPSKISNIKANKATVNCDECNSLFKLFNINPTWLLSGVGEMIYDTSDLNTENKSRKLGRSIYIPMFDTLSTSSSMNIKPEHIVGKNDFIAIPDCLIENEPAEEYNCFQISGFAMVPTLYENDLIIARLTDKKDWATLSEEKVYVIVTKKGRVVSRIQNQLSDNLLVCRYDNANKSQYPNYTIGLEDIESIWHAELHLSSRFQNINDAYELRIKTLEENVETIWSVIKELKRELRG